MDELYKGLRIGLYMTNISVWWIGSIIFMYLDEIFISVGFGVLGLYWVGCLFRFLRENKNE